jgi:hypothetical protein
MLSNTLSSTSSSLSNEEELLIYPLRVNTVDLIESESEDNFYDEEMNNLQFLEHSQKPLLYLPTMTISSTSSSPYSTLSFRKYPSLASSSSCSIGSSHSSSGRNPLRSRSLSLTDEMCPYIYSPSDLLRQRMKTDSPMLRNSHTSSLK